jgi:hypothetical protein
MVRSFWRNISEYAVTNSRDSASLQFDPRELDAGAVGAGVASTGVSGAGESDIAVNTSLENLLLMGWQLRRLVGAHHGKSGKSPYAFIGLKITKRKLQVRTDVEKGLLWLCQWQSQTRRRGQSYWERNSSPICQSKLMYFCTTTLLQLY